MYRGSVGGEGRHGIAKSLREGEARVCGRCRDGCWDRHAATGVDGVQARAAVDALSGREAVTVVVERVGGTDTRAVMVGARRSASEGLGVLDSTARALTAVC